MPVFTRPTTVAAPPPHFISLTIVGSGASTAVPVMGHVGMDCACKHAMAHPAGPNRRNNVSMLITTPATRCTQNSASRPAGGEQGSVRHDTFASPTGNAIGGVPVHFTLVDCGKTFRSSYFRVLVQHEVRLIDALLITHDHADAMAGLDDLRDLQQMHMLSSSEWIVDSYVPTYLLDSTLQTLEERVGYIMRNSQHVGPAPASARDHDTLMAKHMASLKQEKGQAGWNNIGVRRSTALQLFTLPASEVVPFHVPALCNGGEGEEELPLYSLPVEYGKDYISLGFVFGSGVRFLSEEERRTATEAERKARRDALEGKSCVVYISDVSTIIPTSMAFLESLVKIDVLFVDCLLSTQLASNAIHYGIEDTVALVARLKPRYVFCVGMYCDLEHEVAQGILRDRLSQLIREGHLKEGEVEGFELAYDGMEILLPR